MRQRLVIDLLAAVLALLIALGSVALARWTEPAPSNDLLTPFAGGWSLLALTPVAAPKIYGDKGDS